MQRIKAGDGTFNEFIQFVFCARSAAVSKRPGSRMGLRCLAVNVAVLTIGSKVPPVPTVSGKGEKDHTG